MKPRLILACLLTLSCADAGSGAAGSGHGLAKDRPETQAAATLALSSPAFADGGAIPLRHSAYGEGVSPPLNWSGLPGGTKSLALMLEDPDASSHRPFVHWLIWNIDPAAGGIAEGALPAGAVQGRNHRGRAAYFGPRPPGAKHHYHFQLFALDRPLPLSGGADREQLLAAMKGHVLAKGDLAGLFARPR
jgi:Raf kinase inhibitor-like YbhB/YbcL family protein